MRKIKRLFGAGAAFLILMTAFVHPAFAVKQRYKRYYQKKTPYYQDKKPYYQKRDLPNSMARVEVGRKKAEVITEYQPAETVYKIEGRNVACRSVDALSCTVFDVEFSVETVCEEPRITLTVKEKQPMMVELGTLYPKGSCRFDRMLKHELSHVQGYKKALQSVLESAGRDLADEFEAGQDNSKGCKDIQKKIETLVSDLNARYKEMAATENARLDNEDGGHKYDFHECDAPAAETGEIQ